MKSYRLMFAAVVAGAAALALAGCVPASRPQPNTTIELLNGTSLVVDANFFISATASTPEELFVQENIYTAYSSAPIPTLPPGADPTFELACKDAAAIGVRRPVFTNPFTLTGGSSADEIFLLRDQDFTCGETLRFVYSSENGQFRVRLERP